MNLPPQWIDKIFSRLQGIYGTQFTSKFSRVDSGVDVGLLNAKDVWAEELGGFGDHGEAIGYALKNLPADFCPNAIEFRELCRRAPRKEAPALTHALTDEERKHQSEMAKRLGDAIGAGKLQDGIDTHWATHPRTKIHLDFIFEAARRDQRFRPCIEQMVDDGICTADGVLLMAYRDRQFVRA